MIPNIPLEIIVLIARKCIEKDFKAILKLAICSKKHIINLILRNNLRAKRKLINFLINGSNLLVLQ